MLTEHICRGKSRGSPNNLRFSISLLETAAVASVNSSHLLMYLGNVNFCKNHIGVSIVLNIQNTTRG